MRKAPVKKVPKGTPFSILKGPKTNDETDFELGMSILHGGGKSGKNPFARAKVQGFRSEGLRNKFLDREKSKLQDEIVNEHILRNQAPKKDRPNKFDAKRKKDLRREFTK